MALNVIVLEKSSKSNEFFSSLAYNDIGQKWSLKRSTKGKISPLKKFLMISNYWKETYPDERISDRNLAIASNSWTEWKLYWSLTSGYQQIVYQHHLAFFCIQDFVSSMHLYPGLCIPNFVWKFLVWVQNLICCWEKKTKKFLGQLQFYLKIFFYCRHRKYGNCMITIFFQKKKQFDYSSGYFFLFKQPQKLVRNFFQWFFEVIRKLYD